MFLSTNVRYSLRLLIELKKANSTKSLRDVAEVTKISENYLKHLAAKLEKHNILEGKKGPKGGYKMINENVTLKDLIDIFTQGIKLSPCTQDGFICPLMDNCPSIKMWQEANKTIENLFENIRLKDF